MPLALVLLGGAPAIAQDVVKIGYSGPLSGGAAQYGKNVLNGMEMAAAEINADGSLKGPRVLVRRSPQAASLEDLRKMLEAESFFGATTDIQYVVKGGVVYDDDTLDELWPRARKYGPMYWLQPDALKGGTVPLERK